jgi:hypothetical protein
VTLKLCQSSMVRDTGADLAQLKSQSQPGSAAKARNYFGAFLPDSKRVPGRVYFNHRKNRCDLRSRLRASYMDPIPPSKSYYPVLAEAARSYPYRHDVVATVAAQSRRLELHFGLCRMEGSEGSARRLAVPLCLPV